jgi:3',5'-nucleoside bisphosphate phosphatase
MAELLPIFDMHIHSTRSDGLRSPMELAQMARRSGLAGWALTDHDILPDPEVLDHLAGQTGLTIIPGVEISTYQGDRLLHLLGYGFDVDTGSLADLCQSLLQKRRERMEQMVASIQEKIPRFDLREIQQLRHHASAGRKHLARELVRQKWVSSTRGAFEKYLTPMSKELPSIGVPLAEAVKAIHSAGGVAVLAHPPTGMTIDDWRLLATVGLDGLETRFGRVAHSHRRFLEARSTEYGWVCSAGSDYHGDGGRNQLGTHTVTREQLDAILARRQAIGCA